MSTRGVVTTSATSATSAVLVVLATAGVYWSFRLAAAVLVTALVAAGQRWRLPTVTGAGLLGLVVVVGAGPASAAGAPGLVAWAVPTWVVILGAAASHGPGRPAPRDAPTRLRLVAGEVAAALAALLLVVPAADGGRPGPVWVVAGGGLVLALVLAAARQTVTTRVGRHGD